MKIREDKEANYKAIFFNGKTIRMRIDQTKPITRPKYPEIEDVAINDKCLAACPYCYTSATKEGANFEEVAFKAAFVWGDLEPEERPFQIAIGGAGEPTMHSDFPLFVETVSGLGIMPNYTTNGMHLTPEVLEATKKFCGGVAVSYHPHIKKVFHSAIDTLKGVTSKLNAHIIIGEPGSLDLMKSLFVQYENTLDYFVVLPYQAAGRGIPVDTEVEWLNTFQWISELKIEQQSKFAFGALFYDWMKDKNLPLKIDMYEPEIYSGYRMMDDSFEVLRKSSYDLTPK